MEQNQEDYRRALTPILCEGCLVFAAAIVCRQPAEVDTDVAAARTQPHVKIRELCRSGCMDLNTHWLNFNLDLMSFKANRIHTNPASRWNTHKKTWKTIHPQIIKILIICYAKWEMFCLLPWRSVQLFFGMLPKTGYSLDLHLFCHSENVNMPHWKQCIGRTIGISIRLHSHLVGAYIDFFSACVYVCFLKCFTSIFARVCKLLGGRRGGGE